MSFFVFIRGLVSLMRPMEWSKSFANMVVAAITAGIVFGIALDPIKFAIGFAGIALLWSGLYALNDYTDRKADALHPIKKARAIPSGRVPAKVALVFSIALVLIALAIGFFINGSFLYLLCLFIMLVNQILYTMKPFNFKKRPVLDLISGSLVNPVFRFYAGWTLFVPAFNAPILALIFILGLQFGGYGLYRVSSTKHDKQMNYKSSVVCFPERKLRWICYIVLLAGGIAYLLLCTNSFFWQWLPGLRFFGFWPHRFLLLGFLSLFSIPLYKPALRNPQESDMKKMYKILYFHNLLFIAGMIILYYTWIAKIF
ncbi:MAG: UbiA family prenyltransferase [Candidatus ainarchaeum sp.]|nr:UbiA family prenyltransferase [Candidatus ainarchaeum sp.]